MIIYMAAPFARGAVWLARRSSAVLLALTVSGLTAGWFCTRPGPTVPGMLCGPR
jgi:hypothetical protein